MAGMAAPIKPVFFLHVSSAGGTSICSGRRRSRAARARVWSELQPQLQASLGLEKRVPSAGVPRACPRVPATLPTGMLWSSTVQCTSKPYLYGPETYLHEVCFEDFRYVTVLRDPVERIASQLERVSTQPTTRLHQHIAQPWHNNASESSSMMGTAALDNYLTRLLVGPSAFFLPLRSINTSHRALASRILASFVAVVPIERLDDPESVAWLQTSLGWKSAPERRNSHHRSSHQHRQEPRRGAHALGERSLRMLHDLNRHDRQLVTEARSLFDSKVRAAREAGGAAEADVYRIRTQHHQQAHAQPAAGRTCLTRQCTAPKSAGWHLGAVRRRA